MNKIVYKHYPKELIGLFLWIISTTIGLGVLAVLFGVEWIAYLKYVAYVAVYIIFPGIICYSLLIGKNHDSLTMVLHGWVFGGALEMGIYLLVLVFNAQQHFSYYPLAIGALAIWKRRHILSATSDRSESPPPRLILLFFTIIVLSFMAGLYAYQPTIDHHFADQAMYANSAKMGWPLHYLYCHELPLYYHYLFYLHLAAASKITGLPTIILACRLSLIVHYALLIALVYNFVRTQFSSAWLGFLVLFQVFGVIGYTPIMARIFGSAVPGAMMLVSPTMASFPLFFLLVYETMDLIKKSHRELGQVCIITILLIVGSGVRSSLLPIFGLGLGTLSVVYVFRDRIIPWRVLTILGVTLVSFIFGLFFFYGAGRNLTAVTFLQHSPLSSVSILTTPTYLNNLGFSSSLSAHIAFVVMIFGRSTFLLPGVIGLFLLRGYDAKNDVLWLFVGCYLAGVLFVYFTTALGGSEYTFLYYGHFAFNCLGALGILYIIKERKRIIIKYVLVSSAVFFLVIQSYDVVPAAMYQANNLRERRSSPVFFQKEAYNELIAWLQKNIPPDNVCITAGYRPEWTEKTFPAMVEGLQLYGSRQSIEYLSQRSRGDQSLNRRLELLKKLEVGKNGQEPDLRVLKHIRQRIEPEKRLFMIYRSKSGLPATIPFAQLLFEHPPFSVWHINSE